ncbi:MAG: hypothetical protein GF353_19825 [Candidatus Lokiarchaeota archaeon]|nr:hypothetical protein [Candidatus Lokiarchaeota archaeon]
MNKTLLEEINQKLDSLSQKIEKKSWLERFLSVIEKLIIPAALVFIGYQQVQLNNSQQERIAAQFQNELEIKYLELFYHDIANKETQTKAINLLSVMNESLALKLITQMVIANEDIPENIKNKIPDELRKKALMLSLSKYKIEVFYKNTNLIKKRIGKINKEMRKNGFKGICTNTILTSDLEKRLFGRRARFINNEIRYDTSQEKEIAQYLKKIIEHADNRNFNFVKVRNPSKNYISIFIR